MEVQRNKKIIYNQQGKLKEHSLIIIRAQRIEERWGSWASPYKLSLQLLLLFLLLLLSLLLLLLLLLLSFL